MQLSGAFAAKPNAYLRSIYPKEGGYLRGYLQSIVALQTLDCLHKKYSVVKFAYRSVVAMDAFPFKKELPVHRGWPFPRAAPREHPFRSGKIVSSGTDSRGFMGQEESRKGGKLSDASSA